MEKHISVKIGGKSVSYTRTAGGFIVLTGSGDSDPSQALDEFVVDGAGVGEHIVWIAGAVQPVVTPWPLPHPLTDK